MSGIFLTDRSTGGEYKTVIYGFCNQVFLFSEPCIINAVTFNLGGKSYEKETDGSGVGRCGGSSTSSAPVEEEKKEEAVEAAVEAGTAAAGQEAPAAAAAEAPEDNHITVAASPTPHAEILAQVKPILEAQGYELEVIEFEDYVQPNNVVDSGEIDANYFQHINYLEDFNANHGTDLAIAGRIHYEPFGIYPGTKATLEEIADGDTIAIPNDPTNEARALLLLEANGIITLKEGAGITATVNDIESKAVDVQLNEVEAAQVSRYKDEMSYVVLNGNYALAAGFKAGTDALALEKGDSEAIQQYVNVIAVKAGNEELPKIKALVDALKSDEIRQYISDTFEGAVTQVRQQPTTESNVVTYQVVISAPNQDLKLKPGLIIEGSHAYVDLYERKLQSIRESFGLAGYSRKPYRAKRESAGNDNKYAVLTSLEDPDMNIVLPSSFVLDIHRQCWYGEWMDDGEHIMEI